MSHVNSAEIFQFLLLETFPYVETHQNQPTEANEKARVDYETGSRADGRIEHQLFLIELNHS